jgi:hypothetical protein
MKEIKEGLLERLNHVEKKRSDEDERHEGVLQALDREEALIKEMLALEEGRAFNGASAPKKKSLRPGAANEVESEILELLSVGNAAHAAVKGYLIERGLGSATDPNFGRSIQGTLLSMRGRELVELVGEREWGISKKAAADAQS